MLSSFILCALLGTAIITISSVAAEGDSFTYNDVDSLMTELLSRSKNTRHIRPVRNQSSTMVVFTAMSLASLDELDIRRGEVAVSGQLTVTWSDEFLIWNASEYRGLAKTSLPKDAVWEPELVLLNQTDGVNSADKTQPSLLFVTSNGTVRSVTTKRFRSKCVINSSLFPFDSHVCEFRFLLPEFSSAEVELVTVSETIGMTSYAMNGEWRVTRTTGQAMTFSLEDTPFSATGVEYTLSLSRRPQFLLIHLLAPLEIILGLNMMAYFVPVQAGERITYSITLYLAFVFSTTTSLSELPRNSISIAYQHRQMLTINVFIAFGVIWSIMQVRMSRKTEEDMQIPNWLKNFTRAFFRCRKMLCLNRSPTVQVRESAVLYDVDSSDDAGTKEGDKNKMADTDVIITWLEVVELLDVLYFYFSLFFVIVLLATFTILMSIDHGSFIFF